MQNFPSMLLHFQKPPSSPSTQKTSWFWRLDLRDKSSRDERRHKSRWIWCLSFPSCASSNSALIEGRANIHNSYISNLSFPPHHQPTRSLPTSSKIWKHHFSREWLGYSTHYLLFYSHQLPKTNILPLNSLGPYMQTAWLSYLWAYCHRFSSIVMRWDLHITVCKTKGQLSVKSSKGE